MSTESEMCPAPQLADEESCGSLVTLSFESYSFLCDVGNGIYRVCGVLCWLLFSLLRPEGHRLAARHRSIVGTTLT